jgi:hypothetical protein
VPDRRILMSRYERTQYFEALVALRLTYEARSDFDRVSVISIEDAIAYSEAVMAALEIEDEAAVLDEVTTERSAAIGDPRD